MDIAATHDQIGKRFSRLNPAQRRAVYQKIRAEGLTIGQFPILQRDDAARIACAPSYAQMRQWFLWQLEPGSSAYHISGALRLQGTLDRDALQASFDALVERHESLRTVFRAMPKAWSSRWCSSVRGWTFRSSTWRRFRPASAMQGRMKKRGASPKLRST